MARPPQAGFVPNDNAFRWGLWSWPLQERNLGLAVFLRGRGLERQEWGFLSWKFQLNNKTSLTLNPATFFVTMPLLWLYLLDKTHLFRGPYVVFFRGKRGVQSSVGSRGMPDDLRGRGIRKD